MTTLTQLNLVEITESTHGVKVDLMYANADHPYNLAGQIYWPEAKCLLHKDAAAALKKAVKLAEERYGWHFILHDALRPWEAQEYLKENYPNPDYVGFPDTSRHVRGAAIDVAVVGADGNLLDMGTKVDEPSSDSGHNCWFVRSDHRENMAIMANRVRLAALMVDAGFEPLPKEWWHYHLPHAYDLPTIRNTDLPEDYRMMP